MVANTVDMNQPLTTAPRSDANMFAQSSELYSRLNNRSKKGVTTSPWLFAIPVAALAVAGGVVFATSQPKSQPHAAAAINAPAASTPLPKAANPTPAPVAAHPAQAKLVTTTRVAKAQIAPVRVAPAAKVAKAPVNIHRRSSTPETTESTALPAVTQPAISNAGLLPLTLTPAPAPATSAPVQTTTPDVTPPASAQPQD